MVLPALVDGPAVGSAGGCSLCSQEGRLASLAVCCALAALARFGAAGVPGNALAVARACARFTFRVKSVLCVRLMRRRAASRSRSDGASRVGAWRLQANPIQPAQTKAASPAGVDCRMADSRMRRNTNPTQPGWTELRLHRTATSWMSGSTVRLRWFIEHAGRTELRLLRQEDFGRNGARRLREVAMKAA